MKVISEVILAAALLLSMAALWRIAGRVRNIPVPKLSDAAAYALVRASGSGEGLEQLVTSLVWLGEETGSGSRVIIADCGLSDDGRRLARLLTHDHKTVRLCAPEDISRHLED
ncbi:MAG: hypothetical protein LBC78_00270 [Oscillospiraceae bacterium]|jgi:hypothetical protein|nr:hypothetical protein [Oscillospiraceae bacterium]